MFDPGRRRFLASLAGVTGALAIGVAWADEELDVVIRGGRLIDPRAGLDDRFDVGIRGDRVAVIGAGPFDARTVIDARGQVVAPGFVDLLADNTKSPYETYRIFERYKLTDGVTSSLQLHGGTAHPDAWYSRFGEVPHPTNYGASVKIMRIRKQKNSAGARLGAVRRCLEEGALSLSHSLEYQPIAFGELALYGKLAARHDVPFFLHLRHSSRKRELDGVREALRLAERSGCHLHLDHLHSTGASWHMTEAIDLIGEAIESGSRITACVYPYTYWATYLGSRRFGPGWKKRYGLTYEDLRIVGTGERLNKKTARKRRKNALFLVAVPEGIMPLETCLLPALAQPWVAVASDGGIESEPRANNHPRGAGCFATALAWSREHGIPLAEMVRKMTDLPASILRSKCDAMEVRGSLRVGDVADVVVFDPKTVDGRATVENPNQDSVGIEHVLVAGKVAYTSGQITEINAGRAIKGRVAE